MNATRGAAILTGSGLLAVWLAAAATRDPQTPSMSVERAPAPAGEQAALLDVRAQAARLRDYLEQAPSPDRSGRNPFSFGRRAPRSRPTADVVDVDPPAPPVELRPSRPELSLVGIAEDRGPDGPVRRAIIAGMGQLFIVAAGGRLTPRFLVVTIGADAVEIADEEDGATFRLALR
jgi:hypothetical protein